MTPDSHTISEAYVDVGNGHSLWVHDWGRKDAIIPIVFLHGGPGGGCKDRQKQVFDPGIQRVIFFDQRGAGNSLPYGSIENNTTADLVEDIERIARLLKLNTFILTGSSWGSTLGLAYTLRHPKRVKAMVLSGIFTGSQKETDWLVKGNFREFFPEVWQKYLDQTPKTYWADPSNYHLQRILRKNEQHIKASAYAYNQLEGGLIGLDDRFTPEDFTNFDYNPTRIEIHYLENHCFMPDKYLLNNANKLSMPVWLIQGRYDFVCPPITAHELRQRIPTSQIVWTVSGHRSERENWNVMRTVLLQLSGTQS